MTTAKFTIGAILSAVTNTADTLGNTLGTVNTAVNMANAYVSTAAAKQKIDNEVDIATYTDKLEENVAMEETERRIKIMEFTDKSPKHEALYQSALERVRAITRKQQA